jgi:hypothetical protein
MSQEFDPKMKINFLDPKPRGRDMEDVPGINNQDWKNPIFTAGHIRKAYMKFFPDKRNLSLVKVKESTANEDMVRKYLLDNFKTLSRMLFDRAHQTIAEERAISANALIEMGELIGEQRCAEMIEHLMTHESAINNLLVTGLDQNTIKARIKRPFEYLKIIVRNLLQNKER